MSLYINIYYLHHPFDYETEVLPWHQTAKVWQEWNKPFLIIYNAYVLLLYMLQLQICLMRLNETERLWPIIIIVVSVVFILVHASDSSCFGLYSLFIGVVGRGILCGAFQLSTVYQCLLGVLWAGSWLGCLILPAIRAVSILELAANSGSSRMSQPAPNLHLVTQLLTHWVESDFKTYVL